jgi:serine/threonine-protein kinase RIO1
MYPHIEIAELQSLSCRHQIGFMKSAYRKKQEAIERESKALQQIKKRLGVRSPKPLKGATQSPLLASTLQRKANPAPTSDRIPGPAPADDFMHAHKWKRGFQEDAATVKEIRRKASKIAPAYNKGALQYLPDEKDG